MSHQTTIKTQIKDLDALKAACEELGLELCENEEQRMYSSRVVRPLVIKCKGPYDIAVNKQEDGTYALATDWWGGHVAQEVGANFSKLTQLYGVHKATKEARKKGYFVTRSVNAKGQPRLTITGRTL